MDKIFISNCLILFIAIVILVIYTKLVFFKKKNNETFKNTVKFGFSGNHKNIFQEGMDRYYLTSKYNFNLSTREKIELRKIVNPIIKKINEDMKLEFRFVEFEHVTTQYFRHGKFKRFIIDFFIHETNKYYDKRLIADTTLYMDTKKVFVNNLTIGNGMIEKTSDKLSIPHFSNKILSDNNYKHNNEIIGNETNDLDYYILDDKSMDIVRKNKEFNKWILLDHNYKKQRWPCRIESEIIDENGINYTTPGSDTCLGVNNTFRIELEKPNFNPNFKNNSNNSKYNWIRGSSSTGNMFSGGRG